MTLRWLLLLQLCSWVQASSYSQEPVFIPNNLLRDGTAPITTTTTDVANIPEITLPRWAGGFKLPWLEIARRPVELTVQVLGLRLPMNSTKFSRTPAVQQKPPETIRPKAVAKTKPVTKEKLSSSKSSTEPVNVTTFDKVREEALIQSEKVRQSLNHQQEKWSQWKSEARQQLQLHGYKEFITKKLHLPTGRANRHAIETAAPVSIQVQLDPFALVRMVQNSLYLGASFTSAFAATLRFLAPLVVARRGLNWMGEVCMDWYRGRYLRTTYHQVHHGYHKKYQVPAALRSIGRLSAQITILFVLGRFMEYVVIGLDGSHCYLPGENCTWWCCIVWMIVSIGLGHTTATALSVWGGPLRLQTAVARPVAKQIFTRPWRLLDWMRDPDRWFREIANQMKDESASLKPFHPNRLLFPATWQPLYFLQLWAAANAMTGEEKLRHTLMKYLLLQQAFSDEWFRMLMVEKRVALSMVALVGYIAITLAVFFSVTSVSSLGTLMVLPYVVSVLISGRMTLSTYFERRQRPKREELTSFLVEPSISGAQRMTGRSISW